MIEASAAAALPAIRLHTPLLFDLVLKRNLRSGGKTLAARVFETRGFFMR